jgi:formylglycine-generating enzyme required for sulfatase activity
MTTTIKNDNTLPIGYRLQEYSIQSILGQDNFSITYLAQNIKLKSNFVIKEYFPDELVTREQNYHVLLKSQADQDNFVWGLEQFITEGQLLTTVQHPNLVRVLSSFKTLRTAYILMEYEKGRSLSSLLKSGHRLTEEKIMTFLPPLLSCLQAVHKAGILHQDIKPDNICLREKNNTPVLLDFGMARYALAHKSRHIIKTVSPGYTPVELYQFKGNIGPWTDISALGAILYRAISGKTPIKAPARVHTIKQGKKDPLLSARQIGKKYYSKNLLQGIDWSLKIVIKNRPQNVQRWANILTPKSPKELNVKELNVKELSASVVKSTVKNTVKNNEPVSLITRIKQQSQSSKLLPLSSVTPSIKRFHGWILAGVIVVIGSGGYVFYTTVLSKAQKKLVQTLEELQRVQLQSAGLQKKNQQATALQTALQQNLDKTQFQFEEVQKARKTERQQLAQLQSEKAALQEILKKTRAQLSQLYVFQKFSQYKKVDSKRRPGIIIRDRLQTGRYGPEMVWLPAGRFRMGDIQGQGDDNEQPVHWVSVARFAMGRYEVTFAEYDHFADITGREKPNDEGWGRDNRPVINISLIEATAYTGWLSQQTGRTYRLPTEAEWEYAARAGTVTPYWWGNEIGTNIAICDGCGHQWDKKTLPVGYFGANPFGLSDMSGNVREWTCSEYEEKYSGKEQHCSHKNTRFYAERGGSWLNKPEELRVTARNRNLPAGRYINVGFRLVLEN